MCLIVRKDKLKILTAEKDILCYKELNKNNCSDVQAFYYKLNHINPTEDLIIKGHVDEWFNAVDQLEINRGYHSYINKRRNSNAFFVIPKGASYVTGMDNSCDWEDSIHNVYVSNTIVFVGRDNLWGRLRLRWKYGLKVPSKQV